MVHTPRPNGPQIQAGLAGRALFQFVDRWGRVVHEHKQSNLIPNGGLDSVADGRPFWVTLSTQAADINNFDQNGVQRYFRVGTGSIEPSVSDTALVAQVGATQTRYANPTITFISPGVWEITKFKEFDFSQANGTLTEWGFGRTTTGVLFSRELFRDINGDPIALTKTSDFKLRAAYTIRLTMTPVTPQAYTVDITGLSPVTRGAEVLLFRQVQGTASSFPTIATIGDLYFFDIYAGGLAGNSSFAAYTTRPSVWSYTMENSIFQQGNTNPTATITYDVYTAGDYKRTSQLLWATDRANFTHVLVAHSVSSFGNSISTGWASLYDLSNGEFAKNNEHQLVLGGPELSWARAA
jgi:hypothetical protein